MAATVPKEVQAIISTRRTTWITEVTFLAASLHNLVGIPTARNRHFLISNQKHSSCRKVRECPAPTGTCRHPTWAANPLTGTKTTKDIARSHMVTSIHRIRICRGRYPRETCSRKWEKTWATTSQWLKILPKTYLLSRIVCGTWPGVSQIPATSRVPAELTSSALLPLTNIMRVRYRPRYHRSLLRGPKLRNTISRRRVASPLLVGLLHLERRARDTCSTLETPTMTATGATTDSLSIMICRPFPLERAETVWVRCKLDLRANPSTTKPRKCTSILLRYLFRTIWMRVTSINSRTRSNTSSIAQPSSRPWFWTGKSSVLWPKELTLRSPRVLCWLRGCSRDSGGWEKPELKGDRVFSMPRFTLSPTKDSRAGGAHKYLVSLLADLGKKGFRWPGIRSCSASRLMLRSRLATSSSLWWITTECTSTPKDTQLEMMGMEMRIMFTSLVKWTGTIMRRKRVAECSGRILMTSASSRETCTARRCLNYKSNSLSSRDGSSNNRGNSNIRFTPSRTYLQTKSKLIQSRDSLVHVISRRQGSLEAQSSRDLWSVTTAQFPSNSNSWTTGDQEDKNLNRWRGLCLINRSLFKITSHQWFRMPRNKMCHLLSRLDPWLIRHRVCSDNSVREVILLVTETLWPKSLRSPRVVVAKPSTWKCPQTNTKSARTSETNLRISSVKNRPQIRIQGVPAWRNLVLTSTATMRKKSTPTTSWIVAPSRRSPSVNSRQRRADRIKTSTPTCTLPEKSWSFLPNSRKNWIWWNHTKMCWTLTTSRTICNSANWLWKGCTAKLYSRPKRRSRSWFLHRNLSHPIDSAPERSTFSKAPRRIPLADDSWIPAGINKESPVPNRRVMQRLTARF